MQREPNLSEDPADGHVTVKRPRAAERLSHTANRLFYERGIRAVGVDEIVATAGMTKPSLYRNFSSKDELVVACLRARSDRVMAWWDNLEARAPSDPADQIRTLMAEIGREVAGKDYRGCAVTNAAVEFPELDHPARRMAEQFKTMVRMRLMALVERLPTDQPELLGNALLLLIEGARASRHTSCGQGPAAALEASAEALLGAFLRPAGTTA